MACVANKCMSIFVVLPLLLIIKVLQILHCALVNKKCAHTQIFLCCSGSGPTWKQIQREPVRRWSLCAHTPTHTHTEICWRLCSLGQLVSSLCLLTSKLTSTHTLSYFSCPRGDRWRIVHSKPPCPLFQLASFCFWILTNIKVHKETWFKVIKAQTCILQIIGLEKSNKT